MKSKILIIAPLMAMSFATSFGAKPSLNNIKVNNSNNICNSSNPKNLVEEDVWENTDEEPQEVNWGSRYRFSNYAYLTSEVLSVIPDSRWERLKTEDFYLVFSADPSSWVQIRVTTGWWSTTWTGEDITLYDSRVTQNDDGTYTLKIDFTGDPILDVLDNQHLLFTGGGYAPLKLYLLSEKPSYTVTFDLNGGEGAFSPVQAITEGQYATKPENDPTHDSDEDYIYSFKYWSQDQINEFDFDSTPITNNITLYAVWEKHEIGKYTVTFDTKGCGDPIEPQLIKEGNKVAEPEDPTAFALEFDGWYKDEGCETLWDFENDVVKSDTTIYAKWISEVKDVILVSNPEKTEYVVGEDLNLKGLKIKVANEKGEVEPIEVTNDMISGFDKNKTGEQTITITYGEHITTFTVTVISTGLSPEVIIGIIIDVFAALVIIIYFLICLYNRSKNKLSKKS